MRLRELLSLLFGPRPDLRLAALVAVTHLGLISYIVYAILNFDEPDWPMYWFLAIYADVLGAVLWLLAIVGTLVGMAWRHKRPSHAQSTNRMASRRTIPVFIWISSVPSLVAASLQLAASAGWIKPIDGPNFIWPLSVCGAFGTLLWGDWTARSVRGLIQVARQLSRTRSLEDDQWDPDLCRPRSDPRSGTRGD